MTEPWLIERRRFLLGCLGGAAAVTFGACSSSSSSGGGRSVHLPQGAIGFPSPFASNADIGYAQMSLVYDSLLCKDGSGVLLPWLARSYSESADHLTYSFELRDNVGWNDGRPFTADDVAFTFDYYAKQKTLSPPIIIQPPQGIASVLAAGPTTVVIRLASPQVTFLERVAGALPIIPRHVWAPIADPGSAQDVKVLVGTGAYRVAAYSGDGSPLLLTARPGYYLGAPYIKRIEERSVDDAFAGLLSGDVDVARATGLRPDTLAPFSGNPGKFGMVSNIGAQTHVMYWNLGKEGALSDVRFRRAMLTAIDRQELVTRIAAGRGALGNPGFLAPTNPFYSPVTPYSFDLAAANAMLDAAGYRFGAGSGSGAGAIRKAPDGSAVSFELLFDGEQTPMAEVLIAQLRRAGVELRPKGVQIGPLLFGNKLTGSYDIAVLPFPGPGPGGPGGDPDVLRELFSSRLPPTLQAASAYANPTLDDLADKQLTTFDVAARKALVAQIQAIVAQDLPIAPLFYPETDMVFRKEVLDQWYFTPGQFPSFEDNKQLFITGQKTGSAIRPG